MTAHFLFILTINYRNVKIILGDNMKNQTKIILAFLLGIAVSGITVYAVDQINASNITYKSTTVENALNDLYTTANKPILKSSTVTLRSDSYVTGYVSSASILTANFNHYNYFKITNIEGIGTKQCKAFGWSTSAVELPANTEYSINDYSILFSQSVTNTTGSLGKCNVTINFYNK